MSDVVVTVPSIVAGERVYVVCEGRLIGYSPLIRALVDGDVQDKTIRAASILGFGEPKYFGPIALVRGGGAVACTIKEKITGFRGWRYRWWDREEETPITL